MAYTYVTNGNRISVAGVYKKISCVLTTKQTIDTSSYYYTIEIIIDSRMENLRRAVCTLLRTAVALVIIVVVHGELAVSLCSGRVP